jgi:hypothetical protein
MKDVIEKVTGAQKIRRASQYHAEHLPKAVRVGGRRHSRTSASNITWKPGFRDGQVEKLIDYGDFAMNF